MRKTSLLKKLSDHSPTILTCIGAAGVIATAVMAVKATPKAMELLDDARHEKCEELTKLEAVNIAGPVYIPSVIMGATTIACIFGANILNKHSQAALMSAYALLDNSYKEYMRKVEDLYGEGANAHIKEELAKDKYEEDDVPEEESLFFDFRACDYFHAKMDEVVQKVEMPDGMECYIINSPFDPPSDLF